MKKILLLSILFFCTITLNAQGKFKFGNVSKDLVEKANYEQYPDAKAVVVYEENDVRYDVIDGMFKVLRQYVVMLKIITQDGTDKANFEILTNRVAVTGGYFEERIQSIDGYVFNIIGDKVQKTKLDRKYIIPEDINSNVKRTKITLPGVTAGSVVQFKYTIYSDLFFYIPEWDVQKDIPVIYSSIFLSLPEYFKFNIRSKGYETLAFDEKKGSLHFSQLPELNGTTREVNIVAENLPPIKDDKYVFCVDDFSTAVNFELSAVDIPSMPIVNYSTTWASIERNLIESSTFGKWLKYKNPFPEEVAKIVASTTNKGEQTALIYDLLKSKMTWNNTFRLSVDDLKDALKKGSGSNAQFNFILMSMLRDAGFTVKPVLVSPRTMGRFPIGAPSMDKVNSFVIAIAIDDNMILVDGSSTMLGDYNLLPAVLQADQAWFMGDGQGEKGFMGKLNKMELSSVNRKFDVGFDRNNTMKVVESMNVSGQEAVKFKLSIGKHKSKEEYIKYLEAENGIVIDSLTLSGLERPGHGVSRNMFFHIDPV